MACKPEEFRGDKTATDALRWIEEMENKVDVSGVSPRTRLDSNRNYSKVKPTSGGRRY
jgi:hypothetical protein